MKTPILLGALVLLLSALIVGLAFYSAFMPSPSDSNQDQDQREPHVSVGQLEVNNLVAFSNGTVSLDVTLCDGDSGTVEAVIINGTSYSWSEGCSENGTVLNGQTKTWSKEIGSLSLGANIEVTLQASPKNATGTTTVASPPSPTVPEVPEKPGIPTSLRYYYDYYSGVNLFERGVFFIKTSQNPLTQLPNSDSRSYWQLMHDNITSQATDQDFISIVVARGTFPTGGYTIQVESFTRQESDPSRLRFQVNFTDPGEGVIATQAFTNPILLVPVGALPAGRYTVEIHIVMYILTFDEQGKPVYRPIMTFREEVWTQNLTITET